MNIYNFDIELPYYRLQDKDNCKKVIPYIYTAMSITCLLS